EDFNALARDFSTLMLFSPDAERPHGSSVELIHWTPPLPKESWDALGRLPLPEAVYVPPLVEPKPLPPIVFPQKAVAGQTQDEEPNARGQRVHHRAKDAPPEERTAPKTRRRGWRPSKNK